MELKRNKNLQNPKNKKVYKSYDLKFVDMDRKKEILNYIKENAKVIDIDSFVETNKESVSDFFKKEDDKSFVKHEDSEITKEDIVTQPKSKSAALEFIKYGILVIIGLIALVIVFAAKNILDLKFVYFVFGLISAYMIIVHIMGASVENQLENKVYKTTGTILLTILNDDGKKEKSLLTNREVIKELESIIKYNQKEKSSKN